MIRAARFGLAPILVDQLRYLMAAKSRIADGYAAWAVGELRMAALCAGMAALDPAVDPVALQRVGIHASWVAVRIGDRLQVRQ